MVTKQEVINHYARTHQLNDGPGVCPEAVLTTLNRMVEDENGIYDLAAEHLFGMKRRYLTLDEVKESIRGNIDDLIADLQKIRASIDDLIADLEKIQKI